MTEFKTIPHYPNYECDTAGNVRRIGTTNFLAIRDNGKGYQLVKLYNEHNKSGRSCLVHRVVMSTWTAQPEGKPDVNHLDGNKSNNVLSNLEWTSKSDNTRHAHKTGLFASRSKLTTQDVLDIRVALVAGSTAKDLAEKYGVRSSIIYKIKYGQLYSYV